MQVDNDRKSLGRSLITEFQQATIYLRPIAMSAGFFNQPHPFDRSLLCRLKRALFVGLFIALFLGIFQPFGLSTVNGVWRLALGYGLVTFLAMAMIDLVLSGMNVVAEKWTLGKELAVSTLNILLIGVLNAFYSAWVGFAALTLTNILFFTLYTLLIGIFPVTAIVLVGFQRRKTHFAKESDTINREMHVLQDDRKSAAEGTIVLTGENQGDRLELLADELLFLKASDNYVEVHRIGSVRSVLRGSLRSFEEQLTDRSNFFRCHKSHLVNLDHVERVSGNAQGLRLHMPDGQEVPVSRSLTSQMRERLAVRPTGYSHSPRSVPIPPKG